MAKKITQKTNRIAGIPVPISHLSARPDTVDFRDKMYVPTLVEVPSRIPLETYLECYKKCDKFVLNQGQEGACTGFGLAAVANFLLRRRKIVPDTVPVSARMFYEMARRYDEWPGQKYSGSSARGAMKGWHKHGVCAGEEWPYDSQNPNGTLTHGRALDAASRPLGAYFRVNHLELTAMHSALAEVGILYATGTVHSGWSEVDKKTGLIPGHEGKEVLGGHAFAIIGYDDRGFWIQNSWDDDWGKKGFALVLYDDWLANGTDVWVAQLGAPTAFRTGDALPTERAVVTGRSDFAFTDLRPHVISIGNDGRLRDSGTFATTPNDVRTIFENDFPRVAANWPVKRILLYAHGGLVSEPAALQRVEDYRKNLLDAHVYPLAFIWKTDFWATLTNILKDAFASRRPEGVLDVAKDFMLDRLDDTLEPLARPLGKMLWDEMKENALLSTTRNDGQGGAKIVLDQLQQLVVGNPKLEIHIAAHSAGSIFMGPMVQSLASNGPIASVNLWAPACTVELFKNYYLPALRAKTIQRFSLFTLKDRSEQDDHCASIYHKSLLYLVSHACEIDPHIFFGNGTPILGMEKSLLKDSIFKLNASVIKKTNPSKVQLLGLDNAEWIRSPNNLQVGGADSSHALHHGDFDDDRATVQATLARILNRSTAKTEFDFRSSASALADRRRQIERKTSN